MCIRDRRRAQDKTGLRGEVTLDVTSNHVSASSPKLRDTINKQERLREIQQHLTSIEHRDLQQAPVATPRHLPPGIPPSDVDDEAVLDDRECPMLIIMRERRQAEVIQQSHRSASKESLDSCHYHNHDSRPAKKQRRT